MKNLRSGFVSAVALKTAGVLVMLFLGGMGLGYFLLGLLIFAAGFFVGSRELELNKLHALGASSVVLFVINLALYFSAKLVPLVDLSFAVYGLLLCDLAALFWQALRLGLIKHPVFPHIRWVAVYLIAILVSGISAAHRKEVLYFFVLNFGAAVLFYCVVNLLRGFRQGIVVIAKSIALAGFFSALLAVWQLYSDSFKTLYFPFIAARDRDIMQSWEVVSRVVGTWQHPSYLGMCLAVSLTICAYLLLAGRQRWWQKIFWSLAFVVIAAVLLLTNTRSSVLAGALGVVCVYLFLLSTLPKEKHLKKTALFAWLGVLGACALLLYQFGFVSEIYTKPQAWRVDASATIWGRFLRADSMSTESLVQRSQLYQLAWTTFKEHPLVGVGAKNYQFEVEKVFDKATDAHNIFFQTLAEMGVIGFLSLLFLYGSVIFGLAKKWKDASRDDRVFLAAFFIIVPMIFVDSFFNNPLYSLRITAIFWLVIALVYAYFPLIETPHGQSHH
ncbi:MAG: O-antigen ligase family protein [bacterium]|nr:O-antigen ligase family protein [bacterium]